MYVASFPGLLHFCSSVCVQYNMWMRKSRENCGRPRNTYHVNDIRWTQGGRRWGLHSNNVLDFIIERFVTWPDPRCSQDREHSAGLVRNAFIAHVLVVRHCPPPFHVYLAST